MLMSTELSCGENQVSYLPILVCPRKVLQQPNRHEQVYLWSGVSLQNACHVADWSSPHTFVWFYNLDLDCTSKVPGAHVLAVLAGLILDRHLSVWQSGYSCSHCIAISDAARVPLKWNVLGYHCNHGFLRIEHNTASSCHTSCMSVNDLLQPVRSWHCLVCVRFIASWLWCHMPCHWTDFTHGSMQKQAELFP